MGFTGSGWDLAPLLEGQYEVQRLHCQTLGVICLMSDRNAGLKYVKCS